MSERLRAQEECAMAFQLGWLSLTLFTEQARNTLAVTSAIRHYAMELQLVLPRGWLMTLTSEHCKWGDFKDLAETIRAQLDKRGSQLETHFCAGYGVMIAAAYNESDKVHAQIASLGLPRELARRRRNLGNWVNEIHSHFNRVINKGRLRAGLPLLQ